MRSTARTASKEMVPVLYSHEFPSLQRMTFYFFTIDIAKAEGY